MYVNMWTHPRWAGVMRISDKLPVQRLFFDITWICSESRTLKSVLEKKLFT